LEDNSGTEISKKVLSLLLETCVNIIKECRSFRESIVKNFIDFVNQPIGKSNRTSDVIKSVKVLAI